MKKSVVIFLFVLIAAGASAQFRPINFGVKAGVISTNTDILKGGKDGINNLLSDPNAGWQVGLISRINLIMFHIQPEILYNMNGYELEAEGSGAVSCADVKLSTVDVPVLFGLKLLFLRFQAGPTFNLLTETRIEGSSEGIHFVKADRPGVAFTAGVGLDLWKLNVDARYNGNFKRIKQDVQIGDGAATTYSAKFNSWMFSLGYIF